MSGLNFALDASYEFELEYSGRGLVRCSFFVTGPRSYWNIPTSDLPRASLFESESYFLLGPVGTLARAKLRILKNM